MKKPHKKKDETYSHLYGPVPSRRLGYSLGVDIIPFKTCSLDCIYCQLGLTTNKTIRRRKFYSTVEITNEIKRMIKSEKEIDYITFSGSGEPTLNPILGPLIEEIKKITDIPVAVLTNGTLLYQKEVREDLKKADLIVPSLDAATPEVFKKINRPHNALQLETIIQGLIDFRREFKGTLWLEIMLVKGLNDSSEHLVELKKIAAEIKPDKIHLNTVVRPPSDSSALPLNEEELNEIKNFLGPDCEVAAVFKKTKRKSPPKNLQQEILSLLRRRPVTLDDISRSLGRNPSEVSKALASLIQSGTIKSIPHQDKTYYEPN